MKQTVTERTTQGQTKTETEASGESEWQTLKHGMLTNWQMARQMVQQSDKPMSILDWLIPQVPARQPPGTLDDTDRQAKACKQRPTKAGRGRGRDRLEKVRFFRRLRLDLMSNTKVAELRARIAEARRKTGRRRFLGDPSGSRGSPHPYVSAYLQLMVEVGGLVVKKEFPICLLTRTSNWWFLAWFGG